MNDKRINVMKADGMLLKYAVAKYRKTGNRTLLAKIKQNFAPFRGTWAKYLSVDEKQGLKTYNKVLSRCIKVFRPYSRASKRSKNSFVGYVVSALMNQVKASQSARRASKNHPR